MDDKTNKTQETSAELDDQALDEVAGGLPLLNLVPGDEPCTEDNAGR